MKKSAVQLAIGVTVGACSSVASTHCRWTSPS